MFGSEHTKARDALGISAPGLLRSLFEGIVHQLVDDVVDQIPTTKHHGNTNKQRYKKDWHVRLS